MMINTIEITSDKNCQLKLLRKLTHKKYRRQMEKFTVENLIIIMDALKSGVDFKACFITPEMLEKQKEKLQWIQEHSSIKEFNLIDATLNKSYSQLDTPSGITALYEIKSKPLDENGSALYLNGIKDPGNIGTLMRCALAFDVPNIVCDASCVDIYNFKSINAAKDAIFKVNVFVDKESEGIKTQKGKRLIYIANSHEGKAVGDMEKGKSFCLVCGSESHGVSDALIQLADQSIHISISDEIESLNVSTATAILLHGLT